MGKEAASPRSKWDEGAKWVVKHWTVDAVLSKAGRKQLLKKPHHRGASRCPGCSQPLTLPPACLRRQRLQDFAPSGGNPYYCWVSA